MKLFEPLVNAVVRRRYRAGMCATPFDRYEVRVARSVQEHEDAFRLVQIAYTYEGIEGVDAQALRITPQHVLPESTILVAYEEDRIVGTLTLTLDSPARLPLDADYGTELDHLRGAGVVPVEYGSLAVVRRCWHTGVTTLLQMAAHWFSTKYLQATHTVMGVHPKAAPFYRATFGFSQIGPARPHAELHAPVQGLVQALSCIDDWMAKYLRGAASSGLPLWQHFCEYLPPCISMPPVRELDELARWKLPREVFRKLFIDGSDRLETLDDRTRQHLAEWRTVRTTVQRVPPERHPTMLPETRPN